MSGYMNQAQLHVVYGDIFPVDVLDQSWEWIADSADLARANLGRTWERFDLFLRGVAAVPLVGVRGRARATADRWRDHLATT
ncbi:MAG: hypothetical protein ABL994_22490 [Verrucomicrobiales bacterium]